MKKPRILITSDSSALVLAERLKQKLQKEPCEAVLWVEENGNQPSLMTIQMLEDAAGQFDFAVTILTKGELAGRQVADRPKDLEIRAFRAGLLIATIGRSRCFLAYGVDQTDLPSHLSEIVLLPFVEPANLVDDSACEKAIAPVARQIAAQVQSQGRSLYHIRVPTLSVEELWQRERPLPEEGDLRAGEVVVCDTQPTPDEEFIAQVRYNMDRGISYTYFLFLCGDTVEKVCQSLQVILVPGSGSILDFNERISTIKKEKDRVLDDLRSICRLRKLRISFMPDTPQFAFRVHNASSRDLAAVYVRYGETCFIPWVRGPAAEALWRNLPKYLEDDQQDRLFVPLRAFEADKELLDRTLDRTLPLYFPGIEAQVRQICIGAR